MKRFINSNITNQYGRAIQGLADTCKFLASGIARGNTASEFTWMGDMLFKSPGNFSLNPHKCVISFVSDREIMSQEYGNVPELTTPYPCFADRVKSILSGHDHELTSKQYSKISQKYAEHDIIEYLNVSQFLEPDDIGSASEHYVNHGFYRAPALCALGYRFEVDDSKQDTYIWASYGSVMASIERDRAHLILSNYDEYLTDESIAELTVQSATRERIVDVKVNVDNPRFKYFPEGLHEWVMYQDEDEHFTPSQYKPYIGHIGIYDKNYNEIRPVLEDTHAERIMFLPSIVWKGRYEPAKVIVNWGHDASTSVEIEKDAGRMILNTGVHLNESNDQSRVVYSVGRRMIRYTDAPDIYSIQKKADGGVNTLFDGIDIDTERNRRYSAVVMTEPYFVASPISGNALVEYDFVNYQGTPANFPTDADFINNPDIFLRVKGPLSVLTTLNKLLDRREYNTDIITTVTIEDPVSKLGSILSTVGDYYDTFGVDSETFFKRQEDCLDDLIGGVIGVGNHIMPFITPAVAHGPLYSNDTMKVCGAGFYSDTMPNEYGLPSSVKSYLKLYCSNYTPINVPTANEIPILNTDVDLTISSPDVLKSERYELFRPMIKLSNMNGYVKIIKRNSQFKVTRNKDGLYEMIYCVEFPYCPGSYQTRANLNFTGDNKMLGFIYYKNSYINAGSYEVDANGRYEAFNDRIVPIGDGSFCKMDMLLQEDSNGYVRTDWYDNGGGWQDTVAQKADRAKYPADLVWVQNDNWRLMSLVKSKYAEYREFGTYQIKVRENHINDIFSRAMKVAFLLDNRQWKFNEDKYSSYIGRENPTYVFSMDIATLEKDFTEHQALHGPVPSKKRWLYGQFAAHALMMSEFPGLPVSTIGNSSTIDAGDVRSDFTIELWDSKLDNWRPMMNVGQDIEKMPGSKIIENALVRYDPVSEFAGLYSVTVGSLSEDGLIIFPDYVHFGSANDILNQKSNLVLWDTISKKAFHIAFIENTSGSGSEQYYKVWIYYNPSLDGPLKVYDDASENPYVAYEIRDPFATVTKNSRFISNTIRSVDGVESGQLTKSIDILFGSDDYERYVINSKINLRIRVLKNKEKYPVSFSSKTESQIPYVGRQVLSLNEYVNNPYTSNGVDYDEAFIWNKIESTEFIKRLYLTYFKLSSK